MCDYCEMMDGEGIATADEKIGMHVLQYLFTDLEDGSVYGVNAFTLDADKLYELISGHHDGLGVRYMGDGLCFASESAPLVGNASDLAMVLTEYRGFNDAEHSCTPYDAAKSAALEILNRDGFCRGECGPRGAVSSWKNRYAQVAR